MSFHLSSTITISTQVLFPGEFISFDNIHKTFNTQCIRWLFYSSWHDWDKAQRTNNEKKMQSKIFSSLLKNENLFCSDEVCMLMSWGGTTSSPKQWWPTVRLFQAKYEQTMTIKLLQTSWAAQSNYSKVQYLPNYLLVLLLSQGHSWPCSTYCRYNPYPSL